MVMNGSINVLVTLEFAFILALVFRLGLGLDLGLELGFAFVKFVAREQQSYPFVTIAMFPFHCYRNNIEGSSQ